MSRALQVWASGLRLSGIKAYPKGPGFRVVEFRVLRLWDRFRV